MTKLLFFFLLSLISCSEITLVSEDEEIFFEFQKFISKYKKHYSSIEEFIGRFAVFKQNVLLLLSSHQRSYKTGITIFSDLTEQEFTKAYLNLDFTALATVNLYPIHVNTVYTAPDDFDWREHDAVTRVRDQGSCTASWAFSTMGNLEGLYAQKKGLHSLSVQLLIDCDTDDAGCSGGLMQNGYNWLKENGIMFEEDYPYTGRKDTCKKDPSKYIDMKVTGYQKLGSSSSTYSGADEEEMKEFLYVTGPLSIALNANPLQMYMGGIIDLDESRCSPSMINHTALVVGYGVEAGVPYWICKNTWGTSWGENGYFRIARGKGTCGVNQYVITGTVEF